MSRVDEYRVKLGKLREWEPFLLKESRLPGPRANLELLAAVADEGNTRQFLAMVERSAEQAPSGTPGEFVVACGATGLGERIARGEEALWPRLRSLASDSRWRVREGVAMGLQRIGDRDMGGLLRELESWLGGGPLERRAVVAGLCEPRLLGNEKHGMAVLAMLDQVTASLKEEREPRNEEVRALRQALGYCWSVAIAATPREGMRKLERLAGSKDPDVRWIVRENLKKKRLERLDPEWVRKLKAQVGGRAEGTSG